MRKYAQRRPNPPVKVVGTRGWPRGLNQLAHASSLQNNELAEMRNGRYTQNGVLMKRLGSLNLGVARGSSTIIHTLKAIYGLNGNDYFLRISDEGIVQKFNFNTGLWQDVANSPTFSNVYTNIIQAYGFVYFLNSLDTMVKWDGTTWTYFNPLANPSVAPTVTKGGTGTGAVEYFYRYVWFNDVGNTLASANDSLASMPETLDVQTYAIVTLPAAPANTTKVGIWRGTQAGEEVYLASVPPGQTVFNDQGFDQTDPLYGVPASNTTNGFHFYYADVFRDTIIGTTVELGEDTLVFSAGGDKFESFGRGDGGGYYGWRKGEGMAITGVRTFSLSNEDSLYCFKRDKIGSFKFDAEGGAVADIKISVGSVSHQSIHAAGNDLRFWGEEGAGSVLNEPNFANIIRTKILSARADTTSKSVTKTDINRICGVYFDGLSIFGIPLGDEDEGNTHCLVYDEKYVAWSLWDGLTPEVFCAFIRNGEKKLYYGSSHSGDVVEMFRGKSDNGVPITFRITTKQWDMDMPYKYKKFKRIIFIFGNVTGSDTTITLTEDGSRNQTPLALYADTGDQGFGVDEWGTMEFGDSSGTFTANTSGLIPKFVDLGNRDLFSIQATIENDGLNDEITVVGAYIQYAESNKPLPSTAKLVRLPA